MNFLKDGAFGGAGPKGEKGISGLIGNSGPGGNPGVKGAKGDPLTTDQVKQLVNGKTESFLLLIYLYFLQKFLPILEIVFPDYTYTEDEV